MRLMTAALAGLLASTACAPSPTLIAPVETRTPITFSQLLARPRTVPAGPPPTFEDPALDANQGQQAAP